MKIKDNLILRKVGNTWAVFPINEALKQYGNIMKLNETGAFLWQKIKRGHTQEEITEALMLEYEIDKNLAESTFKGFLDTLISQDVVKLDDYCGDYCRN